jgi:hypothetical protein
MEYDSQAIASRVRRDIEMNEPALAGEQRISSVSYQVTQISSVQRSSQGDTVAYQYDLVFRYPYEEETRKSRSRTLVLTSLSAPNGRSGMT